MYYKRRHQELELVTIPMNLHAFFFSTNVEVDEPYGKQQLVENTKLLLSHSPGEEELLMLKPYLCAIHPHRKIFTLLQALYNICSRLSTLS